MKYKIQSLDKEIELRALSLQSAISLIRVIDKLPPDVLKLVSTDEKTNKENLPQIVSIILENAGSLLGEIISSAIDRELTPDEVMKMDFIESLDLMDRWLEVNDLTATIEKVKKVYARIKPQKNLKPRA